MKTTREIYETVTNNVIESLKNGVAPWVRPWDATLTDGAPTNFLTKKAYRGINVLNLSMAQFAKGYRHGLWLTYKQAAELGGQVRKGEKSTEIYFFKMREYEKENADTGDTEKHRYPLLKTFWVFNVEQCDGIEIPEPEEQTREWNDAKAVEAMVAKTGAIINHGGNVACYVPSRDVINMPKKDQFKLRGDYYATLIHELTHWTGHKSRLDRFVWSASFGNADYAQEELVAEMGSAFLCAKYKMDGRLQHASYIKSWLKVLENDHSLIWKAASKAQQAADFILGTKFEEDEEKKAA